MAKPYWQSSRKTKTSRSNTSWLLRSAHHQRWLAFTAAALIAALGLTSSSISSAATPSRSLLKPAKTYKAYKNLRYSSVSTSDSLLLDLYVPNNGAKKIPLIVYVHGGGFVAGSKDQGCVPYDKQFMKRGFAVACISYRLATEVKMPGPIVDVKSAIRSLRANASKYNLYPNKIGAWGDSAGGYLVAMAGTSIGVKKFDKGSNLKTSSAVQAVVDDYGPMDLAKLVSQTSDPNIKAIGVVLGGDIINNPQTNRSYNPVSYIGGNEPPFLIRHGDKDTIVAMSQSKSLNNALKNAGEASRLTVIKSAGHGGSSFQTKSQINTVAAFFDKYLRP